MQPILRLESPNRRLRIEIDTDAASIDIPGALTYRVQLDTENDGS